jgi:hypothetical protein
MTLRRILPPSRSKHHASWLPREITRRILDLHNSSPKKLTIWSEIVQGQTTVFSINLHNHQGFARNGGFAQAG